MGTGFVLRVHPSTQDPLADKIRCQEQTYPPVRSPAIAQTGRFQAECRELEPVQNIQFLGVRLRLDSMAQEIAAHTCNPSKQLSMLLPSCQPLLGLRSHP